MPAAGAGRLAFQLSAADVAAGVRERTNATAAQRALHELRHAPIVRGGAGGAGAGGAIAGPSRVSMRFAPAPAAHELPSPPQATSPFTVATMVGTRPRCTLADCALPECEEHAVLTAARRSRPPTPVGIPVGVPVAPPAPVATGDLCSADPALTQCADQYAVKPWNARRPCFWRTLEVMHGVLVSNELDPERCAAQKGKISDLLGPTGHIERAAAWTHWVGAALFLAYAIVRQQVADTESGAGICASVAAWSVVVTMLSSSFYHSTAPDMTISLVGRFLDYSSIYLGLVTTALADIAVATNSFRDVPVLAAVDIPVAGGVIFFFFLWRRVRIPAHVTWTRDLSRVPREQCPLGRGLFKMQHFDLHHSQLRYATSVLLTAGYFAFAPAAFATFSIPDIGVILGLQAVSFLVLSFGMYVDRVLMWPDTSLAAANRPEFPACIQCTGCGCVMTAHSWWHVIAIASIALTCFAREYALLALPD